MHLNPSVPRVSRPGGAGGRSRRLAVWLVVAVVATACGGDDADGTTSSTATSPASSSVASTATSVADTTVPDPAPSSAPAPAPPTASVESTTMAPDTSNTTRPGAGPDLGRVVVLAEEFMLADVMALGIEPVASTATVPEAGFQGMHDFDTSAIEVLPMTTLSLEYLATLEPDTIITLQFWVDQVGEDVLRGWADLVVVPDGLSIPDRVTYLGEQLGREAEAQTLIAELDAATSAAADAVPDDCVVSLAAIYPGPNPAAFVSGPWDLPTAVLDTGCVLDPDPSDAEPDRNGRVFLSLEQLGMLDAPMIVLLQSESVEGEHDAVEEITGNPLWATLPAVEAGNVETFDRLGYPGVTGQIRFLADFAALFP